MAMAIARSQSESYGRLYNRIDAIPVPMLSEKHEGERCKHACSSHDVGVARALRASCSSLDCAGGTRFGVENRCEKSPGTEMILSLRRIVDML